MDTSLEKDCSPIWTLFQQIVTDMKNGTPMWEDFISKATKLHSALKATLSAIAAYLDAFQKIADAATNARGATKEIGTALTRVCLRHRAIETRMKSFISTLMESLINPLADKADEWKRANASSSGTLGREYSRECKRVRAELRRRSHEAARHARKARNGRPQHTGGAAASAEAQRKVDICLQEIGEKKQQLEEMEEKAVRAALIEERSRFCHFVELLTPVVEREVDMLAEVGHLQEGVGQLARHIGEPKTLPPSTQQFLSDVKSSGGYTWACSSPSRLGSRKSSVCSISSLDSDSTNTGTSASSSAVNCSTPTSNTSSNGTISAINSNSQRSLSQGSDVQSISSTNTDDANTSNSTWPDMKDTAQFERAASAIMNNRPHTISAAFEKAHSRTPINNNTFNTIQRREPIYSRPPIPNRCSSLERPTVPAKSASCQENKSVKPPSSLPAHVTKEMCQATYVNMSELASMAAARAPQENKNCEESSASESSLESSSGYGSQGAFHSDEHNHNNHHNEVEIATISITREKETSVYSVSLHSLDEAVRSLDEINRSLAYATIKKSSKPLVAKRPVSVAGIYGRRGSVSSLGGRPPPPVRRSSTVTRNYSSPAQQQQSSTSPACEADNLPPPPAFLLNDNTAQQQEHQSINVAETVKQLTELQHTPASPNPTRRTPPQQQPLTTFQQTINSFNSYGHKLTYVEQKVNSAENLSSFGHKASDYGTAKLVEYSLKNHSDRKYTHSNAIYAQPNQLTSTCNNTSPLALRKNIASRSHSADRRGSDHGLSGAAGGLIATLSAKLSPQMSPRSARKSAPVPPVQYTEYPKSKVSGSVVQPDFLNKLNATIQQQKRQLDCTARATQVRHMINTQALPDPRVCHGSLMEQIKRGATLRRNKNCNDRSAPKLP